MRGRHGSPSVVASPSTPGGNLAMTQHLITTPSHPARSRRRHLARIGTTGLAAGALVVGLAAASSALIQPGTPARDVTIGLDNDTADNPFIQPPDVPTPQHMNGTDV